MEPVFKIKAELCLYPGPAGWHFITINKNLSKKIKALYDGPRRGFGAVKVLSKIKTSEWKTSIFPTKEGEFLLFIKAPIRKEQNLVRGQILSVTLTLI